MAEQNQATTKDPKKVEAGKRLAEYNCKKREELKAQKSEVEPKLTLSTCYSIGALLAVGVIGGLGLLHLPSQERRSQCHAISATFTTTPSDK